VCILKLNSDLGVTEVEKGKAKRLILFVSLLSLKSVSDRLNFALFVLILAHNMST